jgi:hypothetical protein
VGSVTRGVEVLSQRGDREVGKVRTEKQLIDDLPTLGASSVESVVSEVSESELAKLNETLTLTLTIPAAAHAEGYATRRIDTSLNHKEALAFKAILTALRASNTKLKSGRYVKKPADVYRWIAEQVERQYADNHRHSNRHPNG